MSFVKLDCGILQSSLWSTPAHVRLTFITMLAMTGPDGLCRSTAPGIAHAARLPEDDVRSALAVLEAPDPDSRTPEEDGRRIVRCDGGYRVVNYLKYREYESPGARRTRLWREKQASQSVTSVTDVTGVTQKEKEKENKDICPPKVRRTFAYPEDFEEFYAHYPRHTAKGAALKAWLKLSAEEKALAVIAARNQASWPCFAESPPDKQPHPATWLNARRWEDEPPTLFRPAHAKPLSERVIEPWVNR